MKVENVTPIAEKVFEPITLQVTIESREELESLWHRVVTRPNTPNGLCKLYVFWDLIDNLAKPPTGFWRPKKRYKLVEDHG